MQILPVNSMNKNQNFGALPNGQMMSEAVKDAYRNNLEFTRLADTIMSTDHSLHFEQFADKAHRFVISLLTRSGETTGNSYELTGQTEEMLVKNIKNFSANDFSSAMKKQQASNAWIV